MRISKKRVFEELFSTELLRCQVCRKSIRRDKLHSLSYVTNIFCKQCQHKWFHYVEKNYLQNEPRDLFTEFLKLKR